MITAFSNQKGGVGKTTTALNTATFLAELGQKVLLVDLDPQANLTAGCGVQVKEGNPNIYTVLTEQIQADQAIVNVPRTTVDIIPSSIELAGAEVELVNTISRESILKRSLQKLKSQYNFVLIDCPPSLGLLTINALVAADNVVIPVQSEYFALEGLSQLLKTIDLVKNRLNSKLEMLGIVITMFDSRTNLAKQVAQELVNNFGRKIFETIIPRSVKLSEAPSHGLPISIYEPGSQGAQSYKKLAEEFLKRAK